MKLAFSEGKSKEAWDQDMSTANKLSVISMLTIYIGGKEFTGQTMDDFVRMVDESTNNK